MTDEVRAWMEQEELIEPGDLILAGVSGGADSVCLLLLLQKLQKEMDFSLEVIHVEHGIRGEESRQDAVFVEELCQKEGITCHICHRDVPGYAASKKIGLEEAARILRYDSYREKARETGRTSVKIALAHHADDNAETILFQMIRGSGIKGLCGMQAKRDIEGGITVIRPLLGVTRREIEGYLRKHGQSFRQDSTNLDTDYSRNRIRHKILPQMEKINSRAVSHIVQSAGMLQEISEYLKEQVEEIQKRECSFRPDACEIKQHLFEGYPKVLQQETIHQVLGTVAGSRKDIGIVHVEAVQGLADLQVGRKRNLPYGMEAERTYEGICIRRGGREVQKEPETYEITEKELRRAEEGEVITIFLTDGKFQFRIFDFQGDIEKIQKKTYTKWLNYDKIKCGLQIRRRAAGDYLMIDKDGHKKKLKDYFTGEKVPGNKRDAIWLLAEGSHVIWVVGGRISADYRIRQDTKKILEVRMIGGNDCED